jgi:hypothetical protein
MAVKNLLLISKPLKNLHKVFKNRVIGTKDNEVFNHLLFCV